ncbi:MAG: hypothetical protein RLZZ556_999, partial [Actinomycetota bacterium]
MSDEFESAPEGAGSPADPLDQELADLV